MPSPLLSTLHLIAGAAAAGPREPYVYRPFLAPAPLWSDTVWPWLLLPLCVAVAVVYKSVKCRHMSQVPREAFVLTLWIVLGMAAAAGVLAAVVEGLERFNP